MTFKIAIVGGGLVGSLAALTLAQRGWEVELYELRKDPRLQQTSAGRSINLALSVRGIEALKNAGIFEEIEKTLIPMKGRMIHSLDSKLSQQPYGLRGECINSVDRKYMNDYLLSCAEKMPNVKLFFEYSIQQADFDNKMCVFNRVDGSSVTVNADLFIGTDGAYSKIRQQLMRFVRMNYSQFYIDHAYMELSIPPTKDGQYAIDPNHLHIWPRHTFMMIALPNRDKSFTVTLFMPWEKFESIQTASDLYDFFESTFPDALGFIGKDVLNYDFFHNPKGSLVTVKCTPYNYKDKCLILGDSAHAMVPFYGQGMNCGFEDVLVLCEMLDRHSIPRHPTIPNSNSLIECLNDYTKQRNPDAEAMCDLAMYNYIEMRSSVVQSGYLFRKTIEGWLHRLFPSSVIPLYTMVSFSRIRYSEALARWKRQTTWFEITRYVFNGIGLMSIAGLGLYIKNRLK